MLAEVTFQSAIFKEFKTQIPKSPLLKGVPYRLL